MQTPPENRLSETDAEGILTERLTDDIDRIIELSPIAALSIDTAERITSANQKFAELLNTTPDALIGSDFNGYISMSSPAVVDATDLPVRFDADLLRPNNETVPAEIFRRALADGGSLVFAIDLTERKKAEQAHLESEKKLWQSHRIEALGRLAGGVAHDFNNFLAVLLLHVDILNLHLDADSPIRGRVAEIKEIAGNIANTVRQLFAFGRKQPMTLAPTGLNPVIERFANNFAAPDSIKIELDLSPNLGLCFVDQTQIVQVLQNLAGNAKEAMPGGGALRIATANVVLTADTAHKNQPPGPYIQITVADTGTGIDKSTEDHIFEPFFSPAGADKGSGLTLAMVYGIVKQSKGYIWVDSELGRGTTFQIQFPRIDLTRPEPDQPARTAEPAAGKTVLLVDDEPAVRRITAEFLRMSGLDVLQAASGMEALEIAQAHYQPIHLLLTDLSMPLMNGRETANRITRLHPETAVLFMSGNPDHELPPNHVPANILDFIPKPFSSTTLTTKVHAILEKCGK